MVNNNSPLFIKYAPKKLLDVCGQSKGIHSLVYFVESFPKRKRAVVIHGPSGCGKTATVYAFAKEKGYDIVELNASDFRNKENIENILGAASKQASLFSSKKIILIDELDGMSGTADRGGLPSIVKIIKETCFPIVLIADDIWNQKFRTLRLYCDLIEFTALSNPEIITRLRKICRLENTPYDEIALTKISASADGDLRAAINDLQIIALSENKVTSESVSSGGRDYEEKIFNALRLVFKSFDGPTAYRAVDSLPLETRQFLQWLDQNIPTEYRSPKARLEAYRNLSDADIFESRILRRQHWEFMLYVKYFLSVGVQQSKETSRMGYTNYSRPDMRNIFIRASKNRKAKSIALALSSEFHASSRTIQKSFLPFLDYMCEVNPKLGKEIDILLGSTKSI